MAPPPPTGYAEWGSRAVAGLIDYVAPSVVVYALAFVIGMIGASTARADAAGIFALLGVLVLATAACSASSSGTPSSRAVSTGQSIGKKVAKIKLIKEDTQQPPGGGVAFLRVLLNYAFGLLCGLGALVNYLAPLWNQPKKDTYSDKIVGTVVINWPETASATAAVATVSRSSPATASPAPAVIQQQPGGYGQPQQPQQGYGQPPQQGYGGQQQGW